MLRRVVLVGADVSDERISSIISVTRIGELETLAVTRNRAKLFCHPDDGYVPLKRRSLQGSRGVITLQTAFLVVIAVKTSNLTSYYPAGLCSGDVVSPVRYELGFYIPEDGILHSHRRENLKSYIALTGWAT
jgi:hypothetical protein